MDEVFVLAYEIFEKENLFGLRATETANDGLQRGKEVFPVANNREKAESIVKTLMQNQVFLANLEDVLDDMDGIEK